MKKMTRMKRTQIKQRTIEFAAVIIALAIFALAAPMVSAETLTATVALSSANEVPPIAGLNATGLSTVTVTVNRDSAGNITGGTVNFLTTFNFPAGIIVTGHHIHEGASTINGPVRIDTGLGGSNTATFSTGSGLLNLTVTVDANNMQKLVTNPAGFYVNLHTSVNPGGAIRGQITQLVETQSVTVAMSSANEVPPVPGLTATGTGTITINPTRDALGNVTGGAVTFTVPFNFPGSITVTGLHIHESPVGVNGSIVIDTGISGANTVISLNGTGIINATVPNANTAVLQRLLANPAGFYVNLHTTANPGGAIRGQLTALATPSSLQQMSVNFLPTNSTNSTATITLTGSNLDPVSRVVINGQTVVSSYDFQMGQLSATVPATLLASAGILQVQVRNGSGLLSAPQAIVVAGAAQVNAVVPVTTDAAQFGATVAPESIATVFGTNLASQTLRATTTPLPTSLGGTTVYVNGIAARLIFVSPGQINLVLPPGTLPGTARIVIIAQDGTVSQGQLTIAPVAPSIFTARGDINGAPAGVATTDQVNFVLLNNADGTPRTLDTGMFVSIFGTGFRFGSNSDFNLQNGTAEALTITLGGTAVTALFSGPQGQFVGLDQINFQIPASLAGRGNVDLVITVGGRTANTVRLNIR